MKSKPRIPLLPLCLVAMWLLLNDSLAPGQISGKTYGLPIAASARAVRHRNRLHPDQPPSAKRR